MVHVRHLTPLLLLGACHYDLDRLYAHEGADAGGLDRDATADGGVGLQVLASEQLIGAWIGRHPAVDEDCIACAEERCAAVETSCRADPECVGYTQCVAMAPTPAGQSGCRVQFSRWVRQHNVRERDLTGPYGQCVFRDQCAAQCEGNTDLFCVGQYAWPTTPEPAVPLHLYLTNAIDQTMPLADVKVRVCPAVEVQCDHPIGEGVTDAQGLVELELPTSFSRAFTGYLEIEGANLYPTLLKFSWNIAQETTQIVSIVNELLFKQAIGAIGLEPDPQRGMLQLRMLGCAGSGVRGVHFRADREDDQAQTWYIDVVPKLDATETNAVGSGGIIDLPEGNTQVIALRGESDLVARADAPVRAGFMTVVVFAPLASQ